MPKPTPSSTNTVFFKAELTASITREKSGQYVAHCEALDLYSQGSTKREAEENIIEATELFIQSCIERSTLSEVLQECGFSTIRQRRRKRAIKAANESLHSCVRIPAELPVLEYQ